MNAASYTGLILLMIVCVISGPVMRNFPKHEGSIKNWALAISLLAAPITIFGAVTSDYPLWLKIALIAAQLLLLTIVGLLLWKIPATKPDPERNQS